DWEGYFLIGLFPSGEWCKVQLFSGGRHPRRHCFSAIEGMDGPTATATILQGHAGGIDHHTRTLDKLVRAGGRWDVRAPGLRWEGTLNGMDFHCDAPRIRARIQCAPELLWWVRWRNIVAYWTAFGTMEWNGRSGVALVEHAWGMQTRANLA